MKTFVALATCAGVLVAARPADACSCAPPPPPCEAFWQTDLVFTGKVTSLSSGPHQTQLATFAIDEKFRGNFLGKTIVVAGRGMCGSELAQGKEYFVYASGAGTQWSSSLCSRTAELADAAEDLKFARAIPNRTFAFIEGKVLIEDEHGARSERAGVEVRARGTAHATRTDRRGQYKLQVPAGTYKLDVLDPGARVRWNDHDDIVLPNASACARREIIEVWNGRIQGRLVDHTGKPAANVALSAHSIGGHQAWRLSGKTDANGNYEIPEVQQGSYLVAVGEPEEGGPDERQPIPTTYYPGVATKAKAKRITMVRSGLVTKIDFALPRPLDVYTISGVLKQAGKPLPKVHVKISNEALHRGTGEATDAHGRFKFREIAGAEVTLEVCRPGAGPANYKTACRQVKRKIDADIVVDLEMP